MIVLSLKGSFKDRDGIEERKQGAGYGLDVTWVYHPYGSKVYIDKMK